MTELPGIRVRAVALVVLAALLTGSGLLLDRAVGPEGSAAAPPASGPSGALFCPHGGNSGWEGWVVVTNPWNRRVRVRLTQLGREGRRSVTTFSVGPLRQVYRQVSADDPADATEVEYFGGWVGAGAILSAGSGGELAAERCEQGAHRNWSILDVPTATGQSSYLVVMNPFDEPAEFDVVLRTEKREVAAGALTPYVLAPLHSVGIPVNDYLLQDPDEESLVARVIQRMGRVIAGGLERSAIGIRAEVGVPVPGTRWLIPAGGDAGTRDLVVLNNGASRADLTAVAEAATGQRLVSGPEGFTVGPGEVKTFESERVKDSGLLVAASNDQPVLAALRVNGSAGDSATLTGSPAPSAKWLVLPALPPSGGRSFLLVQNPGREQVDVTFQVIGGGGTAGPIRPRTILSGRTIRISLPFEAGQPVSVLVRAMGGTILAAAASYSLDRRGYAATLGLPMK